MVARKGAAITMDGDRVDDVKRGETINGPVYCGFSRLKTWAVSS